jgi:hypothetical protein
VDHRVNSVPFLCYRSFGFFFLIFNLLCKKVIRPNWYLLVLYSRAKAYLAAENSKGRT